jgi:hypothetical protein
MSIVVWVAAAGWASFFVLGIVWLTKGSPDRIIAEEQKKVMHAQGRELERQQGIIDKLMRFYHTFFQMKKFEVGAQLAAEGKAELVAIHPDDEVRAEAQAEIDELVRLLQEWQRTD